MEDLEYHWIQKWWIKSVDKKNKRIKTDNKNLEGLLILAYLLMPIILSILDEAGITNNISVSFVWFLWFLFIILWIIFGWILIYWKNDWWWTLKFTDKWAELASKVIWYSQFIKSCDENKIKLLLKEDPLFIDRTLPYATAFWMETEFLNKISPLKKDWNAKYFKWKKVPAWAWALRFFIKNDDTLL